VSAEGRSGRYLWLLLLGLAIGWFEAAVVVYLRELYYPDGFRFPIRIVWDAVVRVEMVREAASLLLLASAARLSGRRFLERFAAFMILFGVWDLLYYAFLKLLLDWPASLSDWDVLFLIPLPWVGPVWAPCLVSLALVGVGSYLFLTADRRRAYGAGDWAVTVACGLLVIASFLSEWRAVIEGRVPRDFSAGLFFTGLLLGLGWFLHAERRERRLRALPP
jgi:hypothetical protein